jgi:hypothetical protein
LQRNWTAGEILHPPEADQDDDFAIVVLNSAAEETKNPSFGTRVVPIAVRGG